MRWMAFLLACSAWAGDFALDSVPPGTKVVIGVQWRRVVDSPLGKAVAAQVSMAGQFSKTKMGGIDLLKDVDEMLIAVAGEGQNAPALVVFSGRFNETLRERYHGVPVSSDPGNPKSLTAILNDSTAMAGDAALVRAAIDRQGGGLSSNVVRRAAELSEKYEIWGVADHLTPGKDAGALNSLDAFSFGAVFEDGLEVQADLHVRSQADAEKMKQSLGLLTMMMAGQKQQANGTKFDIHTEGQTLSLSLKIPAEELKKGMQAQGGMLAALMGQQSMMARSASRGAAPAISVGQADAPALTPTGSSVTIGAPDLGPPRTETSTSGDTVHIVLPGAKKN